MPAEVTILWAHNLVNCHIVQIMVLLLTYSFWVRQKELKIKLTLMKCSGYWTNSNLQFYAAFQHSHF